MTSLLHENVHTPQPVEIPVNVASSRSLFLPSLGFLKTSRTPSSICMLAAQLSQSSSFSGDTDIHSILVLR